MKNEHVTITEAAKLLGRTTTHVRDLVKRGELHAEITEGLRARISRASVEKLVHRRALVLASPKLLDVDEAAKLVGCSAQAFRRQANARELPGREYPELAEHGRPRRFWSLAEVRKIAKDFKGMGSLGKILKK